MAGELLMGTTPDQWKDEFVSVFESCIEREGSRQLLAFLLSPNSDFFEAPASTRFHGAYEGGLCEHTLNVYYSLRNYLDRERVRDDYGLEYDDETIAIVALLHDICKVNVYKQGFRNVKNEETGQWEKKPVYEFKDSLPYGHGEKSVYIISGYMKLKREEAFAIRYHMGFAGEEDDRRVGQAFEMFPLALALSIADIESTYFIEGKQDT